MQERGMAARGMVTVNRVVGSKEGDDKGARGGGILVWQWAMVYVCVFVCVERPQKIRLDLKNVIACLRVSNR
jgi:hypothetical protein